MSIRVTKEDREATVYEAAQDLPRFGIEAGDRFVLRDTRDGVMLCRMMWNDDFAAMLRAYPDVLQCIQGAPERPAVGRPTRIPFLSVIPGGAH
jgi:hypothetical protein